MGTGGKFHRDIAAGAWSWPLISIECWDQGCWSYTSSPPFVFMA
jgi:hypothetical protein